MLEFFPYFVSGLVLAFVGATFYVRNPVYALLFLVAMVVNIAFLFIAAKSEFLGLLLLVVYAGAIAILFLFVIMMVNYKASLTARQPISQGWPLAGIMTGVFIFEISRILLNYTSLLKDNTIRNFDSEFSSLFSIGKLLYGSYGNEVVLTAIILLIGVVGSIAMTMKYVKEVPKRMIISDQIKRDKKDSITLEHPVIGTGINY